VRDCAVRDIDGCGLAMLREPGGNRLALLLRHYHLRTGRFRRHGLAGQPCCPGVESLGRRERAGYCRRLWRVARCFR